MPQHMWNTEKIKQCELETNQALLRDEKVLQEFNQDFGRTQIGSAAAVYVAQNLDSLQKLLAFACREKLPLTIRANGLSQVGQSLAPKGALSVDISKLNSSVSWQDGQLIAGCSASWKDIIRASLQRQLLPYVFPYNTSLTLGGVLSVGGLGSSTFKEGIIAGHVDQLQVVIVEGKLLHCSESHNSELYRACLSGTGLFGIIYDAAIQLRPCKSRVRSLTLNYDDYGLWIDDQFILKHYSDYLEAFVINENPGHAKPVYVTNIALEYDDMPPDFNFINKLRHRRCGEMEDKSILDYINRHDPRLNLMKESGAWSLLHPWYECYVESNALSRHLDEVIALLSDSLPGIYHIFPVARKKPYFFKLPEGERILTFNVLPPGLREEEAANAMQALQKVDKLLLGLGGKRYISGWFREDMKKDYWITHYGDKWIERQKIKALYDPCNIFRTRLFPAL